MSSKPFVSIIIPVKNFERTIGRAFQYLLKIDYPRDCWEIIIADGGSTDKTLDIVNSWHNEHDFIKLVDASGSESAGSARNCALKHAKGEFIFFTDGDCAPCKDWVNIILSKFDKDSKIGAVGGEIFTLKVDEGNLTEAYCEHFKFNMVSPRYGFIKEGYFPLLSDRSPTQIAGHRAYFFVTANVAYRKKALEEAGAEFWHLPTGEDIDMCLQVENKGWRLYFAPEAKVWHMHRSDFMALKKVWYNYAMAHPALISKHASKRFEIIFQFIGRYPRTPFLSIPFPVKGFIYIGNFHLMHLCAVALILSGFGIALSGNNMVLYGLFIISAAGLLISAYRFFYWCWFMLPRSRILTWGAMRYMTNVHFILGALKVSKKYKVFCIEPSF